MAITTNDLKNGMTLKLDEGLYQIVDFQHVKPGKGGAFVRTTLKNAGKLEDVSTVNSAMLKFAMKRGKSIAWKPTLSSEPIRLHFGRANSDPETLQRKKPTLLYVQL